MSSSRDPRPVRVADRVYRALLRAYPRRFRHDYWEEMALVFRDSCRAAYLARGYRGLAAVWLSGLIDFARNAPEEHLVSLAEGGDTPEPTRSCSGCYSVIDSQWRVCTICGTVLNEANTHMTRAVVPDASPAPDAIERIRKLWSAQP